MGVKSHQKAKTEILSELKKWFEFEILPDTGIFPKMEIFSEMEIVPETELLFES